MFIPIFVSMGMIRLLLALAVVIEHSSGIFGLHMVGGTIAVQAFYMISGFYMSLILNEKYVGQNGSYKLFITNRLLRLYPVYWAVLALVVGFCLCVMVSSHGEYANRLQPFMQYSKNMSAGSFLFLVLSNLFLVFQDAVMFLGLDPHTGGLFYTPDFRHTTPALYTFLLIPQAWTIGLEITFYLVAPFLVRRSLKLIVPVILASFLLRFYLYQHGLNQDPWTYRFFPCELAFFLLGNVAYRIYKIIEKKELSNKWAEAALTAVLLFTVFFAEIPTRGKTWAYFACFVMALPFIFKRTRQWKLDAWIGELSYPVYISHMFVLALIPHVYIPTIGGIGVTLSICSIAFAVLLNRLIIKPVEKYRQSRVKKPMTLPSVMHVTNMAAYSAIK